MATEIRDDYIPNKTLAFLDRTVYAPIEYKHAQTMMLMVNHTAPWVFTTKPFGLATAKTPASGKSTLGYDVPMLLGDNMMSYGREDTEPSLGPMFMERDRIGGLALDDVGKIFGDSGQNGKHTKIYAVAVKAYRRGAKLKMSVNRVTQEVDIYCQIWMNGLHSAVPEDLFTRSVHFPMTEAPDGYDLKDILDAKVQADGALLRAAMHSWAGKRSQGMHDFMRGPVKFVHPKLEKRKRQKWGSIFAAAYQAGGMWPEWIYDAFVMMELDSSDKPVLVAEQRCLLDAAGIIMQRGVDRIFTSDLLAALRELPDGTYYRDVEDEGLIDELFPDALGDDKRITGTALYGPNAGARGQSAGFDAVPILEAAADLKSALRPPMPAIETTTDRLAFTPMPVPTIPGGK